MPVKTGVRGTFTQGALLRKIRKMCLWCCGGSNKEVEECTCYDCQLWDARMGNNRPLKRPESFEPSHVLKDPSGKTVKTGIDDL